jgi:hypothetical protein
MLIYKALAFEMHRDQIKELISQRQFNQKMKLLARRIVSLTLNMIITFGGIYVVIMVQD